MSKIIDVAGSTFVLMLFTALVPTLSLAQTGTTPATNAATPAAADSARSPVTLPVTEITGSYKSAPKSELSNDPAANPASVAVIEYSEQERRNTRDYGDLLKPITGVSASSFDQGGVGYGFTLRGFSERSNGGNVAYFVDGVPINAPGHQSSNGYGDLNPLIPELLGRLVLTRGPFDVRAGAFALGASAQYFSDDRPSSGATINGGTFGFWRGLGVYTFGSGPMLGYGSALGSSTQGYRENSRFNQLNTFDKLLFPMPGGTGSVRAQAYSNDFGSPGYIPRAAVENGTLSSRAAINSSDGGKTALQNIAFNYKQSGDQPLTANAYVVHSDHDRYATRNGTLPIDPLTAGQFLTHDERVFFGGAVDKYFRWDLARGMGADLLVGAGLRTDIVTSTRYTSIARRPTGQTDNIEYKEVNPFGYVQGNFKPLSWIKLLGGLRYDYMSFDIKDRSNPVKPVDVSPKLGVVQPKAGISVSPITGLDVFANYGRGYRPPSPIGDQLPRDPNLDAAKLATKELGVQFNSKDGVWHFLADIYRTTFTNELLGQPAPLPPISLGPSTRNGFDLEGRVRALDDGRRKLWIFASYSKVNGKLINQASGTVIPDIAEFLAKYGFDLMLPVGGKDSPHSVTLTVAQFWEGPRSLNAVGTLRTKTYSRIDANVSYTNQNWKGFSAFVGVNAYPDRRLEETAFLFTNTVAVSPKAPMTVQAGVFIPF